jgi:hypothetical protein
MAGEGNVGIVVSKKHENLRTVMPNYQNMRLN